MGGFFLRVADQGLDAAVKFGGVADHAQAYALGVEVADFFLQVEGKQTHQAAHFFEGAAPVFGTKSKQSEVANAALAAGLHDGAHAARTHGMAGRLGQAARTGPAAVAIHNDGDVLRQVGSFRIGQG